MSTDDLPDMDWYPAREDDVSPAIPDWADEIADKLYNQSRMSVDSLLEDINEHAHLYEDGFPTWPGTYPIAQALRDTRRKAIQEAIEFVRQWAKYPGEMKIAEDMENIL